MINKFRFCFGLFYYSAKQDEVRHKLDGRTYHHIFMRPFFGGKTREYSEMRQIRHIFKGGKWDDYKFVGIGFFDHIEQKEA